MEIYKIVQQEPSLPSEADVSYDVESLYTNVSIKNINYYVIAGIYIKKEIP